MANHNPWCEDGVVFPPRKILVIAQDMDCARLLARALDRDFPQTEVQTSIQTDTAANLIATNPVDAVVLHRTADHDTASVIRILRRERDVPIIAVCQTEQEEHHILAAGATACVALWRRDE